jgi:hypothetical protein
MFMSNQQSAKLTEPGVGSLYDPTTLVAAQFASVFIPPCFVVLAIGGDQFDASLPEPPYATDRNRSRRRRLGAPASGAGGRAVAGPRLRPAWFPQA